MKKIVKSIGENDSEEKILIAMAGIIGQTLGVDRVLIYDADLIYLHIFGIVEYLNPAVTGIKSTKTNYPLTLFRNIQEYMMKEKKRVVSHHDNFNKLLLKDKVTDLIHNTLQIKSLVWYPFFFQPGHFFILIFNQVQAKRIWSEDEYDFIENVSDQVIVALQKIRLIKEITIRENRLLAERKLFAENIERQTGYTHDELIVQNSDFRKLIFHEDAERIVNEILQPSESKKESIETEFRITSKSGNIQWVYAYFRIIPDLQGRILKSLSLHLILQMYSAEREY